MAKSQIDQHTMYDGAPEMLINRVFEVEALLATAKIKTGETESWKFWKRTSDIMKYSWDYMRSFEWLLRENTQLRQENQYLRARNEHLEHINLSIIILRRAKLQGNFDETVDFVNDLMKWDADELAKALDNVRIR